MLGWQDRVGVIEPGRLADLVAITGDPLTDISELERVRFSHERRSGNLAMISGALRQGARGSLIWSCLLFAMQGTAAAAPGDEIYTRPGTLVPADGTRLNLYCMGGGSPAVIFDSGWEDWAPVWTIVQPQVAKWTRACSYDRAGAGFSDPGRLPRTSVRIADELHSALHHAGIKGPYILIGHAFGGDNVRTFAQRYTSELAGLVLVEADVGIPGERRGDPERIAELRECRDAVSAGKPLPLLPARPGLPERSCAQQFFRGLPEAMWSPKLNAKLLELAQTKVAMYDTYISEMEQMPNDEAYLEQHRRCLGSRPVRVLSTGYHGIHAIDPAHPLDPQEQHYEQEVARAQAKWLELSTNSKQLFTDKSSEYIPFDQPGFVVDAIREVYSQTR
jgi:pimeloyl-ACP methyl ester carboxylesterase